VNPELADLDRGIVPLEAYQAEFMGARPAEAARLLASLGFPLPPVLAGLLMKPERNVKAGTVTREALVRQLQPVWPTIENDLTHASTNGLKAAAQDGRNRWIPKAAREWARDHVKLKKTPSRLR
jgi:hypothetical protein